MRQRTWEGLRRDEMRAAGTMPKSDSWRSRYRPAQPGAAGDPLVEGIPDTWCVAALDEVAEVVDPNPSHRYPTYKDGVVPLLSTREFRGRDGWDTDRPDRPVVPPDVHSEQDQRCRFSLADIIMARKGRLGLPRHPPRIPAYTFSHTLFVIKPFAAVDSDYLLWFLRLDKVVQWLRREMNDNTGVPTLGKATTERLPIPIPPLAEQKRIVAKVDHLMSLLDDLEAKLRKQEETATRLAESLAAAVAA